MKDSCRQPIFCLRFGGGRAKLQDEPSDKRRCMSQLLFVGEFVELGGVDPPGSGSQFQTRQPCQPRKS